MPGQSTLYARHLNQGEHSRDFTVEVEPGAGWLVRESEDANPLREHRYDDWHRVELAISRFTVEALRLKTLGWSDARPDAPPSGSRTMSVGGRS
jgi:hypothetical protein